MKKSKGNTYRVWGLHVVQEALTDVPDMVEKLFIDKQFRSPVVKEIVDSAKLHGIPIVWGDFTSKIGVQMGVVRFHSISDIDSVDDNLGIILDGITDEGNLGSIFRTAAAFGVKFAIVPKRRFGSISPVVARISQGGVYKLKVIKSNLVPAIESLKERGYWVYVTYIDDNATALYSVRFDEKAVFVFGSENKGVSKSILKLADEKIYIPMVGMQSLNVGVAAGIVLYEYRRQWQQPL